MKSILSFLLCSFLLNAQAHSAGPIVISGTGNPAAVFCDKVRGQLVVVESDKQKTTFCAIGKAMVGQWALLSAVVHHSYRQAIEGLLNSSSCEAGDGVIVNGQRQDNGSQISFCEYPDNSIIELETLRGGAQARQNQPLIKMILKTQN
ncbi:MAG: hypothetical protein J7501_06560 [Bdellovibrio sp.]|nr:hypothetical protein [Bdellovibrio sp.]